MGLKTLKELQRWPDDQLFMCNCRETAKKHDLRSPFQCGRVIWRGGGVVSIRLRSGLKPIFPGRDFTTSEMVLLSTLTPVDGSKFVPGENDRCNVAEVDTVVCAATENKAPPGACAAATFTYAVFDEGGPATFYINEYRDREGDFTRRETVYHNLDEEEACSLIAVLEAYKVHRVDHASADADRRRGRRCEPIGERVVVTQEVIDALRYADLVCFDTMSNAEKLSAAEVAENLVFVCERIRPLIDETDERPPKWYSKEEIAHWLRGKNYSESIADELAQLIASNYRLAFNKGFEVGKRSKEGS